MLSVLNHLVFIVPSHAGAESSDLMISPPSLPPVLSYSHPCIPFYRALLLQVLHLNRNSSKTRKNNNKNNNMQRSTNISGLSCTAHQAAGRLSLHMRLAAGLCVTFLQGVRTGEVSAQEIWLGVSGELERKLRLVFA